MDKAVFELSEKLRHPSDLRAKLESIELSSKDSYEIHEHSFNKKLNGSYSKINKISEDIANLSINIDSFNSTQKNSVDILKDFSFLIKDYKVVKEICRAHQNFAKIKLFLDSLNNIDEDCRDEDIEKYHNNIFEKEEFMCELQQFNYDLSKDDIAYIDSCINSIKRNALCMNALLMEIADDYMPNAEIFDKINRIVEKEEKRDMLTIQSQEGEKNLDPMMAEITKMYPRYLTREVKGLKKKLIKVLKSSIANKFKQHGRLVISNLDFVISDLEYIFDKIKIEFFDFNCFLKEYHKNLKRCIDENVDQFDAGEILALIEFKSTYYNTIEAKFNKVSESLGPKLIASESELLEKYSKTASAKLKEWIDNIATMEIDKFNSRDQELNFDEDRKLISPGFINLLQIIKLQLEPISFNKKIFLYITNTVRQHCEIFKEKIANELEKDFLPSCQNKSKAGYEDYCIMFGNSGLKLTQYIVSLPECQSAEVRDLGNIFTAILKSCNYYLSEFVIYTCNPAIQEIFTTEWYENETSKVLLITLEDFLQDYHETMCDFSFVTFIYELCNCLVLAYVKRLSSKKIKLNSKSGAYLKRDYEKLVSLFTLYVKEADVAEALDPLLRMVPLLESSNEELFMVELKSLKISNPNIDRSMIQNIINKRSNMDESCKNNLLGKLNEVFSEEPKKQKSFFSSLLS
jgi:exocyst complex component 3